LTGADLAVESVLLRSAAGAEADRETMAAKLRTRKTSFRLRLFEVMEPYQGGPGSTLLSLAVDLAVLLCIFASIALIPLEQYYPTHHELIWNLELLFTAIFVVEYALRWYASPNRVAYPFTYFAVIDLLAILPTLLLFGSQLIMLRAVRGLRLLRILRLLRLVRLLRFVRYGFLIKRGLVGLRIWLGSLIHEYRLRQLGRLFVAAAVAWFVGANLIHFTEVRLIGPSSPYADYWSSYWNIVIVLVSGIEDKEPVSLLGRVQVTIFLIVGIIVVGMLTAEIVSILVRKVQRAGKVALKPPDDPIDQHILIHDANNHLDHVVHQVAAALHNRHYLLVVCPQAESLQVSDPRAYRNVLALAGDPADVRVLQRACVAQAFRAIVLASEDGEQDPALVDNRSLMQTLALKGRRRELPVVTQLCTDESLSYAESLAGVEFLSSRSFCEGLLVHAVLNPDVTEIFDRLMTFTETSNEFYTVPLPAALEGQTFAAAQLHYLEDDDEAVVLVGIDRSPDGAPNSRFWLNPVAGEQELTEADLVLGEGDRLICIAFERAAFARPAREDLWQGKVLMTS